MNQSKNPFFQEFNPKDTSLEEAILTVERMRQLHKESAQILQAAEKMLEEKQRASLTLKAIFPGKKFRYPDSPKIYMKVVPRQFLLNSTLVSDVLNRGDCFVVDAFNGSLLIHSGDRQVVIYL